MISANTFKQHCDLIIETYSDAQNFSSFDSVGNSVYVKSSIAEFFFTRLLSSGKISNLKSTFFLHGDDLTISKEFAGILKSAGFIIKSVNWLGELSHIQPVPIGIPTLERLRGVGGEEYEDYLASYEVLAKKDVNRDIRLYSNFDITTNLPYRKNALLASLSINGSFAPTSKIGLIENLEIIRRSKFVLSPPGAGPDCFRTWEAIYLGAVPIVLRSHWPFSHLDLPVLIVDKFEDLEQKIAEFENEARVRNVSWEEYFLIS